MTPQGSVSYRPNYVGVPLQGFRRDNKAETAGAIASVRARLDALRRTHTAGDASTRHVNWSRSRNMFVEPRVHSLADFSGGGSSPKRGETIRSSPQFMKALPAISISYLVYEKTASYLRRVLRVPNDLPTDASDP